MGVSIDINTSLLRKREEERARVSVDTLPSSSLLRERKRTRERMMCCHLLSSLSLSCR